MVNIAQKKTLAGHKSDRWFHANNINKTCTDKHLSANLHSIISNQMNEGWAFPIKILIDIHWELSDQHATNEIN